MSCKMSEGGLLWDLIKEDRGEEVEKYLIDMGESKREALLNGISRTQKVVTTCDVENQDVIDNDEDDEDGDELEEELQNGRNDLINVENDSVKGVEDGMAVIDDDKKEVINNTIGNVSNQIYGKQCEEDTRNAASEKDNRALDPKDINDIMDIAINCENSPTEQPTVAIKEINERTFENCNDSVNQRADKDGHSVTNGIQHTEQEVCIGKDDIEDVPRLKYMTNKEMTRMDKLRAKIEQMKILLWQLLQMLKNGLHKSFMFILSTINNIVGSADETVLTNKSRPIFQAVIFGSFKCLRVFLKHGANIYQVDKNKNNIIHYLIIVSYGDSAFEKFAVKFYKQLLKELRRDDIKSLLMMENKEGLRPIELAVHSGCLQMFNCIINTPDVYLAKRVRKGLRETSWYDVTSYESMGCCQRRDVSPIVLLSYADRRILKLPESVKVLQNSMLKKWASVKFKCNIFFIMVWFLLRLFFIMAYYVFITLDIKTYMDKVLPVIKSMIVTYNPHNGTFIKNVTIVNETGFNPDPNAIMDAVEDAIENMIINDTHCTAKNWYNLEVGSDSSYEDIEQATFCLFYIIFFAAFSILFDIFDAISGIFIGRKRRWKKFQGKKKDLIVASTFYRIVQCIFTFSAALIVTQSVMSYMYMFLKNNMTVAISNFVLIITSFLSVWSMMYFIQLLPSLGHFVNSIQRMFGIMINFCIVFILMVYPFPHVFMVLLRGNDYCQAVEGFQTLFYGIYSSFKVMLNMMDFNNKHLSGKYTTCTIVCQNLKQFSCSLEMFEGMSFSHNNKISLIP